MTSQCTAVRNENERDTDMLSVTRESRHSEVQSEVMEWGGER